MGIFAKKEWSSLIFVIAVLCILSCGDISTAFVSSFSVKPLFSFQQHQQNKCIHPLSPKLWNLTTICLSSSGKDEESRPSPTNFREAEILGLRLMQENLYADALEAFELGLTLPGSKVDIIRTRNLSGPSPVGGSSGGTEGKTVRTLDEFEKQAAYYNMACACAKLGNIEEAVGNLRNAYENGFDNIATMTTDPDLRVVQDSDSFKEFMDYVNPKRGGFFGLFN